MQNITKNDSCFEKLTYLDTHTLCVYTYDESLEIYKYTLLKVVTHEVRDWRKGDTNYFIQLCIVWCFYILQWIHHVFTFYIEFTMNYFHNWKMLKKNETHFKFYVTISFPVCFLPLASGLKRSFLCHDYKIIFCFTIFMALLFDIYTFNQLQFILLWYESQSNTNKNSSVFNCIFM